MVKTGHGGQRSPIIPTLRTQGKVEEDDLGTRLQVGKCNSEMFTDQLQLHGQLKEVIRQTQNTIVAQVDNV